MALRKPPRCFGLERSCTGWFSWMLDPQLVVLLLFWMIMEHSGNGSSVEEVSFWGVRGWAGLEVYALILFPVGLCPLTCPCSLCQASPPTFLVMKGSSFPRIACFTCFYHHDQNILHVFKFSRSKNEFTVIPLCTGWGLCGPCSDVLCPSPHIPKL